MRLQSDFALIDVKRGRVALLRALEKTDDDERIPVTITGFITGPWGSDDGESREFSVDVISAEVAPWIG